jgi:diguanylate cyclase (GGDEF)-like protein
VSTPPAPSSHHDALTELPNRRLLDDRLQQALHLAQRRDAQLGLMLVQLVSFGRVNELFGHAAGDAVLREVAQRLGGCLRRADTLARYGADEFAIVLTDVASAADCRVVAERVLDVFSGEFSGVTLEASIGITLFPVDAADSEALLRNADAALYRAKQSGRNQYRFYAQ